MPTEIRAIQCPKCGATQKTEVKAGDFRCDSCGTEYFIDDGSVKFGPTTLKPSGTPARSANQSKAVVAVMGVVVLVIVVAVGLIVVESPSTSTNNTRSSTAGYTWYGDSGNAVYLSADNRPVLLTPGTKVFYDRPDKNADFIAFNDLRDGSIIAFLPLPDATSRTDHPGGTQFDVQEFTSGDIFIIAEKAALFRVRKTSYTVTDVTQSLFRDQPELANGVAKIEFVYRREGEGFHLITNDGKSYFYYPLMKKLVTKEIDVRSDEDAKDRVARAIEKTAFSFSSPWNSDFPEIPAQLITFRYKADPYLLSVPELDHYSGGSWDDPKILERERVVSFSDFTPGRVYFDYGVLYFDSDFVLISYRLTPAKNAPRYVQLLDARTAAISFTTRLDVLYAPTECIRYAEGFAIVDSSNTFTLSLSGKLEKHTSALSKTD